MNSNLNLSNDHHGLPLPPLPLPPPLPIPESPSNGSLTPSPPNNGGANRKRKIKNETPNSNNKRSKAGSPDNSTQKVTALFDQVKNETVELWKKYNIAQANEKLLKLKPQISSITPTAYSSRQSLLSILHARRSVSPISEEQLSKQNDSLYAALASLKVAQDYQERVLGLLKEAFEQQQMAAIEKLLDQADLSNNNPSTYQCLLAAAKTNPQIIRLVLTKKPNLTFNHEERNEVHSALLITAFDFEDLPLFHELLKLGISPLTNYMTSLIAAGSPILIDFLKVIVELPKIADHMLENFLDKALEINPPTDAVKNAEVIIKKAKKPLSIHYSSRERIFENAIVTNQKEIIEFFFAFSSKISKDSDPSLIWKAATSNNQELIERFKKERQASVTDALWEGIKTTKISEFDSNSATFDLLLKAGADINESSKWSINGEKNSLLAYVIYRIEFPSSKSKTAVRAKKKMAATLIQICNWFTQRGADLHKKGNRSAFEVIILKGNPDLVTSIIKEYKLKTHPRWKEILNGAFAVALQNNNEAMYSLLYDSNLIDIQAQWINLIKKGCLAISNSKFLLDKGAIPFAHKPEELHPLLSLGSNEFHFQQNLNYLRALPDYKAHLLAQHNQLGILTYSATNRFPFYNKAFVETIQNLINNDFLQLSPNELSFCSKDIICAHILHTVALSRCYDGKNNTIPSFVNLMPWNRGVMFPVAQLHQYQTDLIEHVRSDQNIPDYSKDAFCEEIKKQFKECADVVIELQHIPTSNHYGEATRLLLLAPEQQREVDATDFNAAIQQMLKATDLSSSRLKAALPESVTTKEFVETVNRFLNYIRAREHVTGVPKGIPDTVNNPSFFEDFKKFETQCRELIPQANYIKILEDFLPYLTYGTVYEKSYQSFLTQLKDAFVKTFPIRPEVAILTQFVKCQTEKENFYVELEDKLRLVIYSYKLEKIEQQKNSKEAASASSSSKPKEKSKVENPYDPTSAFTLLCAIVEAMSKCAAKWGADLQIHEEYALEKIYQCTKKQDQSFKKQTDLERQLHAILSKERTQIIRLWARHWTNQVVEQHNALEEPEELQNAELGKEIHYFYAALQHRGQFYGIPRAEKNVEYIVQWNDVIGEDLVKFFKDQYTAAFIIDQISDGIHKGGAIDRSLVIDWMKDNLIANWELDNFNQECKRIMDSIGKTVNGPLRQSYETILKTYDQNPTARKSELNSKIFEPIWDLLSKETKILFKDFKYSVKKAVEDSTTYDHLLHSLDSVVQSASTLSRKTAFTAAIHTEDAMAIRRERIREMLIKLNVITDTTASASSSSAIRIQPPAPPPPPQPAVAVNPPPQRPRLVPARLDIEPNLPRNAAAPLPPLPVPPLAPNQPQQMPAFAPARFSVPLSPPLPHVIPIELPEEDGGIDDSIGDQDFLNDDFFNS